MRGSDPCPAAGMAKHRRGCGLPPPLSAIAGELRRARTRVQLVHHLRGSWSSTIGARRCECSGVAVPGAPSRSRGNYCGHIRAHDPGSISLRARPQHFGEFRFSASLSAAGDLARSMFDETPTRRDTSFELHRPEAGAAADQGPKFEFLKLFIGNSWRWLSFFLPISFGELQNYYIIWGVTNDNEVLLKMLLEYNMERHYSLQFNLFSSCNLYAFLFI